MECTDGLLAFARMVNSTPLSMVFSLSPSSLLLFVVAVTKLSACNDSISYPPPSTSPSSSSSSSLTSSSSSRPLWIPLPRVTDNLCCPPLFFGGLSRGTSESVDNLRLEPGKNGRKSKGGIYGRIVIAGTGVWIAVAPDVGDVGVGAGKADLGVYIVPVVVVAVDVGVETEPVVPVFMALVSGPLSFKKTFAGVMVAVDNLGVDKSIESWLVTRDTIGGLLDCVAPCGCGGFTSGAAAGTGGVNGGGGGDDGN